MAEDQYLQLAVEIGERILADQQPDAAANPWKDCDPTLYQGVAGIPLFLIPLYRLTGDSRFLEAAQRAGRWLWEQCQDGMLSLDPSAQPPEAIRYGLYVGLAGPALALLELHEATHDRIYLDQALQVAGHVAAQSDPVWLELLFGPPGQGLLFLALHRATSEEAWREAARRCVAVLDETAQPHGTGGVVWSVRRGADQPWMSLGLAHGLAGITFFLWTMARVDPQSEARALAEKAELALRETAAAREGGLDWGHALESTREDSFLVQWCHGAPGVAIAFLNSPRDGAVEIARAAGRVTVAAGDNRSQASQCHGVCGNAETFIELYRSTGEKTWLEHARHFADMALGHRLPGKGPGAFRTHDGDQLTYDLMTGTAGVGYFFLRLADPDAMPYPVLGRWIENHPPTNR